MAEVDNKDLVTGGFLSFSLMAQEIIATMFAFYSYRQGEMALATFYLAIAGVLLVALGIFYIFDRHDLARLLLAGTLLIGFFLLLLGASDASSLMWCPNHSASDSGVFRVSPKPVYVDRYLCRSHLDNDGWIHAICRAQLQRYRSSALSISLCHFGRLCSGHGQLSLSQPQQVPRSVFTGGSNCPSGSTDPTAQSQ